MLMFLIDLWQIDLAFLLNCDTMTLQVGKFEKSSIIFQKIHDFWVILFKVLSEEDFIVLEIDFNLLVHLSQLNLYIKLSFLNECL